MKKRKNFLRKYNFFVDFTMFSMMITVGLTPNLTKEINRGHIETSIEDNKLVEDNLNELNLMPVEKINQILLSSIKEPETNYSGMELSNEYEDQIKEICEEYGVPFEIVLTIGYQESGGKWDNNGKISPTDDYGEFQINKCNHAHIKEKLGYTTDTLLNDPVKNAEAAILLISEIINMDDSLTTEEIFGIYNGWTNWREKDNAVKYADSCFNILCEYFSGFEYGSYKYVKVHA